MKRILLLGAFMVCFVNSNAKTQDGGNTRVMVVSDPHMLVETNAEALNFNKGGKLDKTSPAIFTKALEIVAQAKPQALLVCGDMTFNGEASGHKQVAAALSMIEKKGIPVLVIPGNHDILNPFSEDPEGENVTVKQFKTLYGAFGMGTDSDLENISRDKKSLSWAGSLKGTDLAIIGLDGNIYDSTSEFYSDGCIRKSTLDWMTAQALSLRKKGEMVVCMVHHQLLEHVPGQSLLAQSSLLNKKFTKNPVDGDDEEAVSQSDLQKAFADAQIQYVLTGHFHIHHTQNKTVKNSSGDDFTLTELTTGGLSTYPNWLRTLVFDTKNGQLASSTSSMVQCKVDELDLQTVSKEELTTWATSNYGSTVASLISMMNSDVDKYEIYDGTTLFQLEESAYPDVLYTRYFDNYEWQPLFVPFDMQYDDWSDNFEVARFLSAKGDSLNFTSLKGGDTLKKNTPALIRLKSKNTAGLFTVTTSVKTSGRTTVMPVEDSQSFSSDVVLQGTYEGLTKESLSQNNSFSLSSGQLVPLDSGANADSDVVLLPQRWFLTENSGNADRVFSLSTGIPVVESAVDSQILKNGKYFIDGRLVVVRNGKMFNMSGQMKK